MRVLRKWLWVWTGCCVVLAGGALGGDAWEIRETEWLGKEEFLAVLGGLGEEARREAESTERERLRAALRWDALVELEGKGYAAEVEVEEAEREKRAWEREAGLAKSYAEMAGRVASACGGARFEDAEVRGPRDLRLRVPGITQRVGGVDYFTVATGGVGLPGRVLREKGWPRKGGVAGAGENDGGEEGTGVWGVWGEGVLLRGGSMAVPWTRESAALGAPLMRFRAEAEGELRWREALRADAARRLEVVGKAKRAGVANEVEWRRARLGKEVAEAVWRETEARRRLAQLEWARYRALGEGTGAAMEGEESLVWGDAGELMGKVEALLTGEKQDTGGVLVMLGMVRGAWGDWAEAQRAGDRREAAGLRMERLGRLRSVGQGELGRARSALELARAEEEWAEERARERLLEIEHRRGLSRLGLGSGEETWLMANAAAWGRKIAEVEEEMAAHQQNRAELVREFEEERRVALRPVRERGAASVYEVRKQELVTQMAAGALVSAERQGEQVQRRRELLEEFRHGESGGQESGIPEGAWPMLAEYVEEVMRACPGRVMEREAALDLGRMRKVEYERLEKLGLGRSGEVTVAERQIGAALAGLEAELKKDFAAVVAREMVAALGGSVGEVREPEKRPAVQIEVAPLP